MDFSEDFRLGWMWDVADWARGSDWDWASWDGAGTFPHKALADLSPQGKNRTRIRVAYHFTYWRGALTKAAVFF